MYEYIIQ